MEELLESCTSNDGTDDRPAWIGSLLKVSWGATDLCDYTCGGRTHAGDEAPPLPELAVLMIRTAFEMLLWRYDDGSVVEAVNAAADLPNKLERLIGDELDSLLGEVF